MIKKIFSWFESRIDPYPEAAPKTPEKGLWRFIWSNIEGVRKWIAVLAVFTVGVGIMEALMFQFMGKVVDWLGTYTPQTLFVEKGHALIGMMAMVAFFAVWTFFASNVRLQTLQGVFPMRLRWNFHRLMLGQSLGFYQDEFAGRVSAKVMQTALALRDVVMTVADMVVYVLVYFITSGVILSSFDVWLILPFDLLDDWIRHDYALPDSQARQNRRASGGCALTDDRPHYRRLFQHHHRQTLLPRRARSGLCQAVDGRVYGDRPRPNAFGYAAAHLRFIVNSSLTVGTTALGIWLWYHGQVGVGAVATATAMALRVNGLSQYIMWESARLFENIGTVNDGMATLSKPHTILDKPQALPLKVTRGEIKFDHVDFSYEAGKPLLNGFNLNIKPGEKVGLIGRSGAGKSTIVNLLLRFYEPQSGTISIDGQSVDSVTQESLRAQIGLVTQDTSLLHRSVRDNIIYGRPDATEAEMISAAERAEAAGFIPNLSDAKGRRGYDAHVGERGVKLSGGQRQRIAIARVMLKDAPILLLDEATSALDSEVEAAIQESLDKMMEGKTVIAIAHRLSTIAAMDRLIVLDKGRIIEEGSHTELLEKQGLYAKLWAHQSGGFLSEHVEWENN